MTAKVSKGLKFFVFDWKCVFLKYDEFEFWLKMRKNRFLLVILVVLFVSTISCQSNEVQDIYQTGDLVFQDFEFGNSAAIKLISNSKYSHMGMIVKLEGKNYVYEAVQPVQVVPLEDWIARNPEKKFEVKRLKNRATYFTEANILKFKEEMNKYLDKNYDGKFAWSDNEMYCSEIVWKIYSRVFNLEIGKLQQMNDLDFSNPVVAAKLEEIYQGDIPLHEWVISPQKMYESELLETVK
jgi:hypothetical protein